MLSLSKMPIVRIFSTDKLVKSNWLNKLGIQKLRIKSANFLFGIRAKKSDAQFAKEIAEYYNEGILRIDQFLSSEDFENLSRDCNKVIATEKPTSIRYEGPNTHLIFDMRKLGFSKYPAITKYLSHPGVRALFRAAEKREIDILKEGICQLQLLEQGEQVDSIDPETELHSDTFFNTNKAWIYISDVEYANAPFVFVNRSHTLKNTPGRLDKEYVYSLDHKKTRGSRRITKEEVAGYGLEESVYNCTKNTFVMANTFGFHKRLKGSAGKKRLALSISTRFNPFLP